MSGLLDTKGLADLVMQGINRIWPDKTEQEKAQAAGELAAMLGQIEINKAEAQSGSLWVAGWRPFIGWTCGSALLWKYIIRDILVALHATLPPLDVGPLITLLLALLGMGTMRTVEKHLGVQGKH